MGEVRSSFHKRSMKHPGRSMPGTGRQGSRTAVFAPTTYWQKSTTSGGDGEWKPYHPFDGSDRNSPRARAANDTERETGSARPRLWNLPARSIVFTIINLRRLQPAARRVDRSRRGNHARSCPGTRAAERQGVNAEE
jgi:hypothetical protein